MSKIKLDVSEHYFEHVADQASIGLIIFEEKDWTCIYANQLAKDVLHVTNMQEISISELEPKGVSNASYRTMNKSLLDHEGLYQQILMRKLDGSFFVAQLGVKHLIEENEKHCLLIFQDMTLNAKLQRDIEAKQNQLKSAYEELLEQNKQLKALDLAKTKFIALVTHELRTPTSGIVATAEMLKLGIYDSEAQLKEFIGMIHAEGKILLELINDILDFAKIQSGKMDYFIEEKNIVPVIEGTLESLETYAKTNNIKMIRELNFETLNCYFDSLRIHQVINNLVSNGIKYNHQGGTVTVSLSEQKNFIRLQVKDTGKGISKENQPKIFNEFETLGKISNHTKGTGLGLPIAKRMIEAMGGQLGFTSEEGVGSTFWIDIPTTKVLTNTESYRSRPDVDSGDLAA